MLELRTRVGARHGLHARPSSAVVLALADLDAQVTFVAPSGQSGDAASITQLQALGLQQGDELLVRASGPEAHRALEAVRQLAERNFGDRPDSAPDAESLAYLELEPDVAAYIPAGGPEQERVRLETAMAAADGFIEGLAAKMPEAGVTGAVLGALRAMLHDPSIGKGCRQRLDDGQHAVEAVQQTFEQSIELFQGMQNDYLRERATDLRALQRLVVKALMAFELALPEVPAGRPLALDELDALTAAQIDPEQVPLVLVRAEGTTGHGIIVAQDRGLPVRVGAGG
ncbi:HPr family phosphocarrier protein [Luteococcus sp. H154]|uniref:HPr family phosphocarrier protein n=1 Tax=Luteococcus sp. H154 TaxID=3139403 RepID=UPI00313E1933